MGRCRGGRLAGSFLGCLLRSCCWDSSGAVCLGCLLVGGAAWGPRRRADERVGALLSRCRARFRRGDLPQVLVFLVSYRPLALAVVFSRARSRGRRREGVKLIRHRHDPAGRRAPADRSRGGRGARRRVLEPNHVEKNDLEGRIGRSLSTCARRRLVGLMECRRRPRRACRLPACSSATPRAVCAWRSPSVTAHRNLGFVTTVYGDSDRHRDDHGSFPWLATRSLDPTCGSGRYTFGVLLGLAPSNTKSTSTRR